MIGAGPVYLLLGAEDLGTTDVAEQHFASRTE